MRNAPYTYLPKFSQNRQRNPEVPWYPPGIVDWQRARIPLRSHVIWQFVTWLPIGGLTHWSQILLEIAIFQIIKKLQLAALSQVHKFGLQACQGCQLAGQSRRARYDTRLLVTQPHRLAIRQCRRTGEFQNFVLAWVNPIPTRLCHVIYCCSDKSYPCLVGIGLTKTVL